MIRVDFKGLAIPIVTLYLQSKDNRSQLQVVSGVVTLIKFLLSGAINNYLTMLHEYTSQTYVRYIIKKLESFSTIIYN